MRQCEYADQTFLFYSTYCCIIVCESKTGIYRQGDQLFIALSGTPLFPVKMLERYFVTATLTDATSNDFIFHAIMFCSKTKKQRLRPDKFKSGEKYFSEQAFNVRIRS